LIVPAVLSSIYLAGIPEAHAENPACYTVASIQGSWALVGTYGANVALTFAARVVDANGNFSSVYTLNAPTAGSTTGERTISTGNQTGTYTVNCDGTGTIARVQTAASGAITDVVDDFIITAAVVKNGVFIATAIVDATRTPSGIVPGGIFVTRVHTRLPDRPGPTQP
jgi:hypothetical protein